MSSLDSMTDEEFEAYMNSGKLDEDLPPEEEEIVEDTESEIESDPEPTEEVNTEEESPVATEQPNEDSENTAETEEGKEETTEDPTATEEETAESTETEEDGKSEEVEAEPAKVEDDVLASYLNQKTKVKASGTEFEFTNQEKLEVFDKIYQQAIDYTKKTQAIAPYRKRISAMEELGMTDEQFNMMVDVLKGDKNAITAVVKQAGIDALELDTEAELDYKPSNYGKSDLQLDIDEAYQLIDSDPKGQVTRTVIANQWDDRSRNQILEGITTPNGRVLKTKEIMTELHRDVVNGIYDQVAPRMMKLKVQDGARKSDLDYYLEAGAQYNMELKSQEMAQQKAAQEAAMKQQAEAKLIAEAKAKQEAAKKAKEDAEKRKAAAVTRTPAGTPSATDYLDMDAMTDEEFMVFMDKQIKKR